MKSLIRIAKTTRTAHASYQTPLSEQTEKDFSLVDQVFNRKISIKLEIGSNIGISGLHISRRMCLPLGGSVSSKGLVEERNLPEWLNEIMDAVHKNFLLPSGFPRPNHALINVYEPGDGIMPHEDGPAYSPYATVLSLGSSTVFDFVSKVSKEKKSTQVYLPVGSLLFFTDYAYSEMLHEIRFEKSDIVSSEYVLNADGIGGLGESFFSQGRLLRGKRISITMRHVPKVEEM